MLIFLDSANLEQITAAVQTGLISGVTTNPSLLSQESNPQEVMEKICALVPGPVSLQVVATEASEMVTQGKQLAALAPNVVVKVPLTFEGLKACALLRGENIEVNVTLCFSLAQGVLAARAGASYVSPFVGRLEDAGESGEGLLAQLAFLYETHQLPTRILAASIRNRAQFEAAAEAGAHVATVPFAVFQELLAHPLSIQGLKRFSEHGQELQGLFSTSP